MSDLIPSQPGARSHFFVLNASEIVTRFDTLEYTGVEWDCGPMRFCYGWSYLRHWDKNTKLQTCWLSKSWLVRMWTGWSDVAGYSVTGGTDDGWSLTAARVSRWSPPDPRGPRPPPAGSWWSPSQPHHYWDCWNRVRPWCHPYQCVNDRLRIRGSIVSNLVILANQWSSKSGALQSFYIFFSFF